uniref:ABC transporter n=2 Tax=Emiliania huxleyi TaxID=2903 RepID=A0A7S3SHZ5_EMIHU
MLRRRLAASAVSRCHCHRGEPSRALSQRLRRCSSTPATATAAAATKAASTSTTGSAGTNGASSSALPTATAMPDIEPLSTADSAALVRSFLWPERWRLAGGFVLLTASSSISLVFPRVMGEVMDGCLSGGGSWTPDTAALALFALSGVQAGLVAYRGYIVNMAGESVSASLRSRAFSSLMLASTAFHDSAATGELLSRLSADAEALQRVVTTHALNGLRGVIMVGGCSLAMVSLSPKLCLVSFATFPAAVLLSRHMGKRIKARQRAVQEALAAAAAEAHSALLNVRTLRLFAAERLASERYDERVRAARDEAATAGLYAAAVESGVGLAMQSSLLSVLAVGGQQVLDGALSYGELSSFFMYTLFLGFNAGNIATAYAELRRAAGASERVLALIGRPPPLTGSGTLPDCRGEFAFENLRFAYPTRPAETILDGLSLRVRQGERVAVIGQSGSGKSTLISLLTGLYEPAGGRVLLDGVDVSTLDPDQLRRECVAVVPQEPVLLSGSLRDNIALGKPDATEEELRDAARRAGCDFALSGGAWEREVGEQGMQLSGGQRQRIALARVLLRPSPVVALDEFTAALDPATEAALLDSVEEALAGRTLLLVTHRKSALRIADRVVELGPAGRVISDSSSAAGGSSATRR